MMKYKHIKGLYGDTKFANADCHVEAPEGTHHFMFVADYLTKRFEKDGSCTISNEEDALYSEIGFREGLKCWKMDLWEIRNSHLANRNGRSLDDVEADIKHHQEIYKTAYGWGREAAIKKSEFPFLKELPIRTVKVAI